ncbi:MAG: molybdopterin-dependent oxidoreductase [Gemmatimonadaceae bacterium]
MAEQTQAPGKTVTLTIEGRQVTVPEGTSILEAAKQVGVLIPHYCYHPGLPVAGVCRMCLVDVEKAPKLAPSCATAAMDGQVVHVHSEKALDARKGVLEMLLINHPLDCPICDQSGECELQDYTFQEGRKDSRYREAKRFNPVEDFGGDVVYVPNRCILCTRCVRFMEDVAHDPVLNVSERGDRALIGKFPDKDLTHPWAANVVDLCPVGALLSKDSLNKARAWELDRTASVCPNCTQGCNVIVETRDNTVVRLKPRFNEDVNEYFICDYGRLNYRWLNRQDRVSTPMVRRGDSLAETDWDTAIAAAANLLKGQKVSVIASPMLSNETLFLLSQLIDRNGGDGSFTVETGPEAPLPGVEDLSLRADRAANVVGAERLGFKRAAGTDASAGGVVVIAGDEHFGLDLSSLAAGTRVLIIGSVIPDAARGAEAVLPVANMAEEEGTFTNIQGRVQRFRQAKAPPGHARSSWSVVGDLLHALGGGAQYFLPSEVFAAMAGSRAEFKGLNWERLGSRGLPVLNGNGAEARA